MDKLETIERNSLLAAKNVLNLNEACFLTGLSRGYLYHLTSDRKIPFYKQGKYLYFDRGEIEKWMLQNRIKTKKEMEGENEH